jgi:hypothetical protein
MTSPLLDYANGYLLVRQQGTPSIVNGRVQQTAGTTYLVQCYLKRQDSTGTSTGADYVPVQSRGGAAIDGASGQIYLYRGYALRYAVVSSTYDLEALSLTGVTFSAFTFTSVPEWLVAGVSGSHKQGREKVAYFSVETCGGKFGNSGIDELINNNIEGIPIVIRSGQVLN